MARKRTSLRQLAALADVVRAILDDIAARGGPLSDAYHRAVDLADARARGAAPTREEVDTLTDAVMAHLLRFGGSSAPGPKAVYWIGGSVCRLLSMARAGVDDSSVLLAQAGYAFGFLHEIQWTEYGPRVKAMYAAALAQHTELSDEPLSKSRGGIARRRASSQTAAASARSRRADRGRTRT